MTTVTINYFVRACWRKAWRAYERFTLAVHLVVTQRKHGSFGRPQHRVELSTKMPQQQRHTHQIKHDQERMMLCSTQWLFPTFIRSDSEGKTKQMDLSCPHSLRTYPYWGVTVTKASTHLFSAWGLKFEFMAIPSLCCLDMISRRLLQV